MNEKERRLAAWCRERGFDGVLLRRRTNVAWLTDGADIHVDGTSSTGIASLLWTPRKKVVHTSTIEARRLADEEFGSGWDVKATDWWRAPARPKGRYAADFPDDPFADVRMPLTGHERRRIRWIGRTAGIVLGTYLKSCVRPGGGISEQWHAANLTSAFRHAGLLTPVMLVATDARIARYRHPVPTSRRVGKTLLVAVNARRWGLTVALTRIVHFARRLPPDLRRRHEAVCAVDTTLHRSTQPGARWCDVLAEGIREYRRRGFGDEWKRHHQGGPIGYEGREFRATPSETRRVPDPQAVAWNPSITGTKSEDTILTSGEILTETPDWPVCGSRPDILCRPT